MNVSPLDLRQQRFRKSFRGFDPIEVASFLAAVADDYEQALRETDRLKQDLMRMEAVLTEHREHEKNLQATMTTAQKLSDDIKASAELEAKRIIREAEGRSNLLFERTQARAEDMLEKAQARVEDIQREIDGLKLKRKNRQDYILQPCPAYRDAQCSIYLQRPERCRLFECQQLKRVASGAIT
jgi:cell division initiation protein